MITKFKIFEYNDLTGFEVGDRVDYYNGGWHSGVVTELDNEDENDNQDVLVKFDNRWTDDLHDGNGDDGSSMSWFCHSGNLRMGKEKERRFTNEDPYGEEEWEVNENLESDEDFKVISKTICKKTLKANFGNVFTRGKEYNITGYSIKDKKFFVSGNNSTWFQFNLDEMREYFTNNPLPRVFSEEDPYGEEDWLGESIDNEIKIGDIVRVDKDFVIAGSTIFSRYNDYEVSGVSKSGISIKGFPGWYSEWAFKKYTPVELDELDPYGEERWEDGPKYKNGDKINISHDKYAIIKEFDPYKREYTVDYYFKNSNRYLGYGLMDEDRLEKNGVNEKFSLSSRSGKVVYYTQTFIDDDKVKRIMKIITPEWIKNNPVAFEVYKGQLYLTEGHHRFEACLKLNDKELLKTLFNSAVYYNVTWQPRKFKKKIIQENHNMLNEAITPEKVKAAVGLIKQTIKGTEWEGKVFIAGGAVRDELMGNDPKDVDLLINVPDGGIKFADWITTELGIHTKGNPVIYPRFGTAKFSLRRQKFNGEDLSDIDIECVMPRKETYFEGDRKPDVSQGTLKDDVFRRDFSVNSLLKDLSTDEILDLTGMGKDDIKAGIVRTPLDPDVIFTDDPLRMLRAVRFTTKYGWKLPLFMIRSLKRNAKKLQNISSERIREELDKMLLTKTPDKAIRLLQILGLSKYIFPELDKLIKMKQNKFHKYDAMRHTLEVLKNTPPDLVTRLSALLHDVGKGKTKTEIKYIKCDNCDKKIEI